MAAPAAASEEEVAELSPAQEGLYFLQRLVPDSAAYNTCAVLRVRGLEPARFRRAGELLIARHPQLRARFVDTPEGPRQCVPAGGRFEFREEDARGLSAEALTERLKAEAAHPFDLTRGGLLRVVCFERGPREHALLFVLHHVIADLWSAGLLLEGLGELYGQLAQGALPPPAVPTPAQSYLDYSRQLQARLRGDVGEALWRFWKEELEGALTPLSLPTDRPRPPLPGLRGGTVRARIPASSATRVRALAEQERAPLLAVLLATLELQLWSYTGARDVLVTTPVHGRTRRALHGVFGQFVNSTVVRGRPRPELRFRDLIEQTRGALFRSLRHSEYPLHWLVQRLGPSARIPLAQVQLALQDLAHTRDPEAQAFWASEPEGRLRAGALEFEVHPLDAEEGQFDLHLLLYTVGDGFSCHLKYDSALFDAATAERILEDFLTLLDRACAGPELPLSTLGPLATAHTRVAGLSDDEVERQLRALLGGG